MRLVLALLAALCAGRASGAAQFLDPSGDWRTLHTPHFRVHFRPAYRAAALEAAREAERAYRFLAAQLPAPRGTIDLTLTDDSDLPNGVASVVPSNRVTVVLAPPAADPSLQHYDSWLRLVTVHELAHVFHLDRSRGVWRVLQAVFGRAPGLFPNAYQPSWVTEGLATYYESKLTGAGRVEGSLHPQLLGADAAAGATRSPWDALFFTRWPHGFTPYAYGAMFFDHASRRAGDSVVPRFVEATAKQLIPYRVGRQLRRAGAGDDLGAAWGDALRAAALTPPDSTAADEEVLLARLRSDPSPALSADGRWLAYLRNDGKGAARLIVADARSMAPRRSRRVNGGVSFDWAGDTLLVAQFDFTDRWRLRTDLHRWEPGGAWRRVTRGGRITEPRTGGGVVAWVGIGPGGTRPNLPEAPDAPGVSWGSVAPSPDGRWVAAARHAHGYWSLVRWPRAAPESLEVLLASRHVVADPMWDGDRLLFVWDASGLPQLYRWDEGGVVALTAARHGARSPTPLPDGSIVYASFARGGWTLTRARPTAGPAPTVGPPRPFDPAPPVPVRETGYTAWPSLRPHYWLPVFRDADRAGFFAGAGTAGADALGRHLYVAQGLYSWDPARAMGAVAVVTHALGNPSLDVGAATEWSYVGRAPSGRDVSARETDVALGFTLETRRWRTAAAVRVAAEYEGLRYGVEPDGAIGGLDLVGGSATLAVAHQVVVPLSISPQDGFAWAITYRRREAQGGPRWSDEWRTRAAVYLPVPGIGTFARPVLGLRAAGGIATGPLGPRFDVGGVATAGFDYLSGRVVGGPSAFFVRGYPAGERRGSRAVTASAELRLPLALVGRSLGHLPVGADRLSLSLFADAGDAWSAGAPGRLTRLRSAGAEVVADLTYNYDAPLRLRLGVAKPLEARAGQAYLALGSPF